MHDLLCFWLCVCHSETGFLQNCCKACKCCWSSRHRPWLHSRKLPVHVFDDYDVDRGGHTAIAAALAVRPVGAALDNGLRAHRESSIANFLAHLLHDLSHFRLLILDLHLICVFGVPAAAAYSDTRDVPGEWLVVASAAEAVAAVDGLDVCCSLVGREPFCAHVFRFTPWRQRHTSFLQRSFHGIRHQINDLLETIFSSDKDSRQALHNGVVLFRRTCNFELGSEVCVDQYPLALLARLGLEHNVDVFVVSSRKASRVIPSRFANGGIVSSGAKMVHYRPPRRGVRRSFIFFYSVLLLGCIQRFGDFREQDPLSDVDRRRQSLERYDPKDTPQKAGEDEWVQQKKEKQKKTRSVYEICRNKGGRREERASNLPAGFQKALHRGWTCCLHYHCYGFQRRCKFRPRSCSVNVRICRSLLRAP